MPSQNALGSLGIYILTQEPCHFTSPKVWLKSGKHPTASGRTRPWGTHGDASDTLMNPVASNVFASEIGPVAKKTIQCQPSLSAKLDATKGCSPMTQGKL